MTHYRYPQLLPSFPLIVYSPLFSLLFQNNNQETIILYFPDISKRIQLLFSILFIASKKIQKNRIFSKKGVDKMAKEVYNIHRCSEQVQAKQNMREWRNWQTRTFEGRVVHTVRVQVPFLAPTDMLKHVGFFITKTNRREKCLNDSSNTTSLTNSFSQWICWLPFLLLLSVSFIR